MQPDSVGQRIRRIRKLRGLTLRQLAGKAAVPAPTLSLVERGKRHGSGLSLETGRKLAEALGITLDWLAGVYRED